MRKGQLVLCDAPCFKLLTFAAGNWAMRGMDQRSGSLLFHVDLESRVRADHPLRTIRTITNDALLLLSAEFEALHVAGVGRPSIPSERLVRALLLQAFYGIRSQRQIMEGLELDLLFR